ncbi:MAG: toxin-antitoxin system YwqK family antitoxin [Cytophagales bacterium]
MERLVRFLNSSAFISLLLFSIGCQKMCEHEKTPQSIILLRVNNSNLEMKNGLLLWNKTPFTGTLFSLNESNTDTLSLSRYLKGREHGEWKRFYEGGNLREKRFFVNGSKEGEFITWWPNGKKQLHYHFSKGEYEGACREWNEQGALTKLGNYTQGYEEGTQQLWYDNGKIRANYVIKSGRRFGLLGTKNCINVSDSVFRK